MERETWSELLDRLLQLQTEAATVEGDSSGLFEHDLTLIENALWEISESLSVSDEREVLLAIEIARDIATVEALSTMRSEVLPRILDSAIASLISPDCDARN